MQADPSLLDTVRIASPCSASWEAMEGDDRVRFCRECRLNVYNLSEMTRAEAEELVREAEGRLCVRLYQRRDGTMLTSNCPVGLWKARRWLLTHVGGTAGAFGLLLVLAPLARAGGFQRMRHSRLSQVEPFRTFFDWVDPPVMMGAMPAVPPLPPKP